MRGEKTGIVNLETYYRAANGALSIPLHIKQQKKKIDTEVLEQHIRTYGADEDKKRVWSACAASGRGKSSRFMGQQGRRALLPPLQQKVNELLVLIPLHCGWSYYDNMPRCLLKDDTGFCEWIVGFRCFFISVDIPYRK